jgi:hypothetical protein
VMPFTQVKQSRDGVDIAPWDQHAGYGRRPESLTGVQRRYRLDL